MHQCSIGFVLWSVRSWFKTGKAWSSRPGNVGLWHNTTLVNSIHVNPLRCPIAVWHQRHWGICFLSRGGESWHQKLVWECATLRPPICISPAVSETFCWSVVIQSLTMPEHSLCQRLGLTRAVRNKPRARSTSIECRRCESPPEAKDELSESFAGGARGFAKQNRPLHHEGANTQTKS